MSGLVQGRSQMGEFVDLYVKGLTGALGALDEGKLALMASQMRRCIEMKKTIFLLGNGGSSATPSHSAADWMKELRVRCVCLTDNVHLITAISNDIDYASIFALQLNTMLSDGDLVIAYSGSGNSENVIRAVEAAKGRDVYTIGITGDYKGMKGGRLKKTVDLAIVVAEESMERIEDCHLIINHIVKEFLKATLPESTNLSGV